MKNILFALVFISICNLGFAQVYTTSDFQMIFSWADVKENGVEIESPLRWSPVFNLGTNVHRDFGDKAGIYAGLNVKNIGFIANTSTGKEVHKSYNLGIPVALKIGNMEKGFVYGGYELEIPFYYKNKSWDTMDRSGTKQQYDEWFSDAMPSVLNTVFVGVQMSGINIKFKYYMTEFLNQDYVHAGTTPNADLEAQVYSISLVASFLRGSKFYYSAD